jgi:hypothetical protein
MELSSVATALEILSKASKALDSLREQSKTSKDAALKENISKLYDDFLDLKAVIIRLTDENAELRRKQTDKPPQPKIKQEGLSNYYYVDDDGPFCQPCYDGSRKLSHLSPRQFLGDSFGRKCGVCGKVSVEQWQQTHPTGFADGGPWG